MNTWRDERWKVAALNRSEEDRLYDAVEEIRDWIERLPREVGVFTSNLLMVLSGGRPKEKEFDSLADAEKHLTWLYKEGVKLNRREKDKNLGIALRDLKSTQKKAVQHIDEMLEKMLEPETPPSPVPPPPPKPTGKVADFLKKIKPPPGFKIRKMDPAKKGWGSVFGWVEMENADKSIEVTLLVNESKSDWDRKQGEFTITGEVYYTVPGKGRYSIGRRGVDSAFWGSEKDLKKGMAEAIKRAEEGIKRVGKSTAIVFERGGKFMLTPEALKRHRDELKTKGSTLFRPSGFGTGYNVSKRRKQQWSGGPYTNPVPPEVEKMLGMKGLFFERLDFD